MPATRGHERPPRPSPGARCPRPALQAGRRGVGRRDHHPRALTGADATAAGAAYATRHESAPRFDRENAAPAVPAPRSELADELALEPATLSPLVKRLEAQGRVTRSRRSTDERVLDLALTESGQALRSRAVEVPLQVMERVGTDAATLVALRDALAHFAGSRVAAR